MSRKLIELPAAVARAFVKNMLALPRAEERDQARRDRGPSAARAQATLHRQASAFRRERDVFANEGSRLTRIGTMQGR
jgi:hypothetical protein